MKLMASPARKHRLAWVSPTRRRGSVLEVHDSVDNGSTAAWLVQRYEMWYKLFGCHLNYLYAPLLDVKIGLLCSAAQQIFHSLRI